MKAAKASALSLITRQHATLCAVRGEYKPTPSKTDTRSIVADIVANTDYVRIPYKHVPVLMAEWTTAYKAATRSKTAPVVIKHVKPKASPKVAKPAAKVAKAQEPKAATANPRLLTDEQVASVTTAVATAMAAALAAL